MDLLTEMGLSLNLNTKEKSSAFRLIQDPEFLLKFQFVSLAKHHNLFGAIDEYMKEFARICVSLNNRTITNNLERHLNSEVSFSKQESSKMMKDYESLPRELDPMVLAQPSFQF